MSDTQATTQAEAAMQPLWTNDRIIQAASDVGENPSPHSWLRVANIVDVIRLVRADYEARLATLTAERDEALAQLASLNKFIDDTLREMVEGEDE